MAFRAIRAASGARTTVFLLVLEVLLLGACIRATEPEVRRRVVGTWRNRDGATLVIRDDGTFRATALPANAFGWGGEQEDIQGTGTWDLRDADRAWAVELFFPAEPGSVGRSQPVHVGNDRSTPYLYVWEGDPDSAPRYRLDRVESPGE